MELLSQDPATIALLVMLFFTFMPLVILTIKPEWQHTRNGVTLKVASFAVVVCGLAVIAFFALMPTQPITTIHVATLTG